MADSLSYICTPTKTPYMYQAVPDRLCVLANDDPEREAFIFYSMGGERTSVTRKEVYQKSLKVAKCLYRIGVRKGTPIVICMNNSLNALYVEYGVSIAGGILYPIATNLKDGSDIIDSIADTKAEYLIIDASTSDQNWNILEGIWPSDLQSSEKAPTLKHIMCNGSSFQETVGRHHLSDWLYGQQSEPEETDLPAIYPEDTLVCFCTSGSTGKPKHVICSHFFILNYAKQSATAQNITNYSIYFCDRQFSWTVGFPRAYLATGCTRVFIDTRMSLFGKHVDLICDIIEKENVDVAYAPGYLAKDLISRPELAPKFKRVNVVFISGERFPMTFLPLKDTFCKKLVVWYGSTESGGFSAFQSDKSEEYEDGIIGIPLPGAEMKIIDEKGDVVPVGVAGEVCTRSAWRFNGYHGMSELYDAVLDSQGWFHTGDVGHMRKDGNFVVEGRSKELISMQTMKFFPWDIEKILRRCPGLKQALAVGVPHPRLNQAICACVVPESSTFTTENLKGFCDETFLEEATAAGLSLKPQYFLIFDEIPLTTSGKLDRRRLGFYAKQRLGL